MDEDYDACDLENWFLAIQSADGQVVIPSFHRPGILTGPSIGSTNDWTLNSPSIPANNAGPWGNPKILRPRQADNSPLFPPDPSIPDPSTGKLSYDIDNDGDGITDSVWVDLGYPVQRDPGGKLYKPLFAFMVLGLNGRLPLNTVGNLQARAIGDQTNTLSTSTGETPPNGTAIGSSGFNSSGDPMMPNANAKADATTQVPYPGFGPYSYLSNTDSSYFIPQLSSQVYLDAPLWDHTSHLGYSVNEINPKFALQNAPSNLYPGTSQNPYGVYPFSPFASNTATAFYSQYDNVGVSVALTQLRNILAGTVPTDVHNPLLTGNVSSSTGAVDLTTFATGTAPFNNDLNVVMVNGSPYVLPNNVADAGDNGSGGVQRLVTPVAGRWGEVSGVPQALLPATQNPALYSNGNLPIYYPMLWYNNPVRAGRSFFNAGTNDAMDDDFDAFDPLLASGAEIPTSAFNSGNAFTLQQSINSNAVTNKWTIPLNLTTAYTGSASFYRNVTASPANSGPEFADYFDAAGQMGIASERIRRFNRPIDPSGSGRIVGFLNRPNNDHDFGNGFDSKGRVSFYRYFRPAGMPQEIRYPYTASLGSFTYPYNTNSGLGQQYLMPVLLPAGYSNNTPTSAPVPGSKSDIHNNRYAGYQSSLTPVNPNNSSPQVIASMGAMPYDWDLSAFHASRIMLPTDMGTPTTPAGTSSAPNRLNLLAADDQPQLLGPLQLGQLQLGPKLPVTPGANPPHRPTTCFPIPSLKAATVVNGYLGNLYNHPIGRAVRTSRAAASTRTRPTR